jgi:hypothetical protein
VYISTGWFPPSPISAGGSDAICSYSALRLAFSFLSGGTPKDVVDASLELGTGFLEIFIEYRRYKRTKVLIMARPPIEAPTPMPALAPVERVGCGVPEEDGVVGVGLVAVADSCVLDAVDDLQGVISCELFDSVERRRNYPKDTGNTNDDTRVVEELEPATIILKIFE